MSTTLEVLQAELRDDPEGLGYAGYLPHAPGQVVRLLNEPSRNMIRSRYITARTAMAELGAAGAMIMEKLEQFGAREPFADDPMLEQLRVSTKWAMRFVSADGEGLDIGNPVSQSLLGALGATGVLTEAEVDSIVLMALQPASRAEQLLGEGAQVTEADVRAAIATGGGE